MSVCCHKCGRILIPEENHRCVNWIIKFRILIGSCIRSIASFITGDYWKCDICHTIELQERESKCRFCAHGRMIFNG